MNKIRKDGKISLIIRKAQMAYDEGDHKRESKLWRAVLEIEPKNYRVMSNLASALAKIGENEEALVLFDAAIAGDPMLSRAYNNKADLLVRMGFDIHEVLPLFLRAISLSNDHGDILRHFLNFGFSSAFHPNGYGREAIVAMSSAAVEITRKKGGHEGDLYHVIPRLAFAFGFLSDYTVALSKKRWSTCESFLSNCVNVFLELDIHVFDKLLNGLQEATEILRILFVFFSEMGSKYAKEPYLAQIELLRIVKKTVHFSDNYPYSPLFKLIDVCSIFMDVLSHQIDYVTDKEKTYIAMELEVELMMWLSSKSFRRIGDELIRLAEMTDREFIKCQDSTEMEPSRDVVKGIRERSWEKISLWVGAMSVDLSGIDLEMSRRIFNSGSDNIDTIRGDIKGFALLVERQCHRDIFVDGTPRESVARGLLQASLSGRSYREVPSRGGKSDLLVFIGPGHGRVLVETKIWRGKENYEQGLREISEYMSGESDDGKLTTSFYIIFDPTSNQMASRYIGCKIREVKIQKTIVTILCIHINPPTPSKVK